jgi:hypothetical protein
LLPVQIEHQLNYLSFATSTTVPKLEGTQTVYYRSFVTSTNRIVPKPLGNAELVGVGFVTSTYKTVPKR